ncbi:ATP-dependent helicase, C-terminal [Trema orientale]|uniref:ATP-dependent helicase, C-terminal n=1 Tax=Trema orientale TaxID=63057 RepID=A0A2P5EHB3_TREOI|nr:ATP-dependent helicase, C-terminal [Trema orientale]
MLIISELVNTQLSFPLPLPYDRNHRSPGPVWVSERSDPVGKYDSSPTRRKKVTAIPSRENPSSRQEECVPHRGPSIGVSVQSVRNSAGVHGQGDLHPRSGSEGRPLPRTPTGTGKSLSLLCSTLARQQSCKLKIQDQSKPDPQAMADPLAHGGTVESEDSGAAQTRVKNKNKKKKAPTIFYTSKLLLSKGGTGCPEFDNMGDIARDAGSVDIKEEALHSTCSTFEKKVELEGLCEANASDLLSWIGHRRETLEKREFQHYFSCWTGDKALRELQEADISQQSFPSLLGFATKAIRDASDTKNEVEHLSGMSGITLEAVVFRDITDLSLSVILTSGQDALGKSLEEIFKIVPGGCLVFFPSYKLLEKLRKRWCETGQWSHFSTIKSLFVEPRGGSQEDFESVLKGYYDAIHGAAKPHSGREKRTKKLDFNRFTAIQCADNTNTAGAALFAVC